MSGNERIEAPVLKEKHSAAVRIWHWCTFIVISSLLITVLIQGTVLKQKGQDPPPPGQQMGEKQGPPPGDRENLQQPPPPDEGGPQQQGPRPPATPEEKVTRILRHNVWEWHKYFGFVLAALFLFRILAEFFQPADEKFFERIKNVRSYLKLPNADTKSARHYYIVKSIYISFYSLLTVIVGTGLTLAFSDGVASFKPYRHDIQEVHEFCMYMTLLFITIHLSGVIWGELTNFKGVVSGMINGKPDEK